MKFGVCMCVCVQYVSPSDLFPQKSRKGLCPLFRASPKSDKVLISLIICPTFFLPSYANQTFLCRKEEKDIQNAGPCFIFFNSLDKILSVPHSFFFSFFLFISAPRRGRGVKEGGREGSRSLEASLSLYHTHTHPRLALILREQI